MAPRKITDPPVQVRTDDIGADGLLSDDAALALVNADQERAEAWIAAQEWKTRWHEAEILYQSPQMASAWEGTSVTRASVPNFLIAQHVNSILPQFLNGLFFDDPPFLSRPRPGTTQASVDAMRILIGTMMTRTEFPRECERFLYSQLVFGTGIAKYGWCTKTKTVKRYERKGEPLEVDLPAGPPQSIPTTESDDFETVTKEVTSNTPFFEAKDIRHVLVDPGCRYADIRKARYVIDTFTMSIQELEQLRKDPAYNLPTRAELDELVNPPAPDPEVEVPTAAQLGQDGVTLEGLEGNHKTTDDPEAQQLEVSERWDKERVITVLNKQWVIRNENHEFGQVPFLSANFYDVPFGFWGLGIGKLAGPLQRTLQGTANAALDILALAVNQQYVVNRDANVPSQNIRQRLGGIVTVDGDPRMAIMPMEMPKVPPEVWMTIQALTAQAEAATGANELLVQGAMPSAGRTSMGRTATGASAMSSASASRLDGPFNRFLDQVYVPYIYIVADLIKDRLPIEDMRQILGDELGQDYKLDANSLLNSKYAFDVLAGSRMGVQSRMAQALPLMMQLFDNPALVEQLQQEGYTVDVKELMEMFFETTGWKDNRDVIRSLTPQEQQAKAQNNPAAAKMAQQQQLQQQKFQQQQSLLNQKNEARAAEHVLRMSLEKTEEPVAVQGQPGGEGFGA